LGLKKQPFPRPRTVREAYGTGYALFELVKLKPFPANSEVLLYLVGNFAILFDSYWNEIC